MFRDGCWLVFRRAGHTPLSDLAKEVSATPQSDGTIADSATAKLVELLKVQRSGIPAGSAAAVCRPKAAIDCCVSLAFARHGAACGVLAWFSAYLTVRSGDYAVLRAFGAEWLRPETCDFSFHVHDETWNRQRYRTIAQCLLHRSALRITWV